MKTFYSSYSTQTKINTLNGRKNTVNYNTKYYWLNKGREKIEKLYRQSVELNFTENKDNICDTIPELCRFFMMLLQPNKKLSKKIKTQRKAVVILIEKLKNYIDLKQLCACFGISERTFFNWKRRPECKFSSIKQCPTITTQQVSFSEKRLLIERYFSNTKYSDYSTSDLYAQTLADKKVIISESLFYEMDKELRKNSNQIRLRKCKKKIGLKAEEPFQFLHMDRTRISINNNKSKPAWIYLICDNKSRAILGYKVSLKSHSAVTLKNLMNVINNHSLQHKNLWLISDDGSENKGEIKQYLKTKPNIKHKIAQLSIPQSNSMIEAVIKQLKYYYLSRFEYNSLEELKADLELAIIKYNTRPRKIHLGKSPLEALFGDQQNPEELKAIKEELRNKRLNENKEFKCLKNYCITEKTPGKDYIFSSNL